MTDQDQGFTFTDRYGGNYPDPATMCQGQCDGMGCYPQYEDDPEITDYEKGEIARIKAESGVQDGAYFIVCGECGGTGKRAGLDLPAPQGDAE